jgi:hypothetical protein
LQRERAPFARQNAAFCNVKGRLSQRKRRPFAKPSATPCRQAETNKAAEKKKLPFILNRFKNSCYLCLLQEATKLFFTGLIHLAS